MSLFQISRMCLWYSESPLQLLIFPGGAKIIFWQKILVVNFTFVKKYSRQLLCWPPRRKLRSIKFPTAKNPRQRRKLKCYQICLTAPSGQCRICLIAFDRVENISNLTFSFSQCWSVWPDSAKCPPAEIHPTIYRNQTNICPLHV